MNEITPAPPSAEAKNGGGKIGIVLVLAVAIVAVFVLKTKRAKTPASGMSVTKETESSGVRENLSSPEASAAQKLPRLVDLGAGKCIPCKMMEPILRELKREYAGRMEVEVIDVWETPSAGKRYGIRMIPTQIFYDAEGRELFRHEGFISKEDILKVWKRFGIDFASPEKSPSSLPEE